MTIKNLSKTIGTSIAYNNFSEEVEILSETKLHAGYSIYEIVNKNGVTFHAVPGQTGISESGIMGFVNGDRGRPTLLGAGTKMQDTSSDATPPWTDTADISASVYWDIRLSITDSCGNPVESKTKTKYIRVF